jgi:hypothetical protein
MGAGYELLPNLGDGGVRRRYAELMQGVFVEVLELCRTPGLIRLGLVALDGTQRGDARRADRPDSGRGEDDMEVRHRQQLGLAGSQPLGAGLPLALGQYRLRQEFVGVTDEAALAAVLDMAAERCRPAQLRRRSSPGA